MAHNEELHVVIMGSGGTGKTALIIQYVHHRFRVDYEPTIEDSYRKPLTIGTRSLTLDILDTAGQDEYAALKEQYMQTGEGFILAFSLVDKNTLAELELLYKMLLKVKSGVKPPVVLVGNKIDICVRDPTKRQVSEAEAKNFAAKYGFEYFETSAKDGTNVDAAWLALVQATLAAHREDPDTRDPPPRADPPPNKSCCVIL